MAVMEIWTHPEAAARVHSANSTTVLPSTTGIAPLSYSQRGAPKPRPPPCLEGLGEPVILNVGRLKGAENQLARGMPLRLEM